MQLANADTGASVLEWYEQPLIDLFHWSVVVSEFLKKNNSKR